MAKKGTGKKTPEKTIKKAKKNKGKAAAVSRRDRLTDRQEAFCIYLIIDGMSQREAYRAAYPNCKAKDSVVDVKRSKLAKMDKVRIRIDRLMDDSRRRRYRNAVANAPKVEDELLHIAMGTKTYTAYDMNGNEYQRLPSIGQRTKALSELHKVYNDVMDKNEFGEEDDGKVIVNVTLDV